MGNAFKIAGRLIYGIPLAAFGLLHFMGAQGMQNMVPAYFGPTRLALVYITGAALIAAAGSVITKILIKVSMPLLAVMLLIFICTIHLPGIAAANGNMQAMAMPLTGLLKDAVIAGAALFIAGAHWND